MRRIIVLIFFLSFILLPQKIFAYHAGDEVYICLSGGKGSCKAVVKRIGKETVQVKWLETCETVNSFLGLGDFKKGEKEWIADHAIKTDPYYCK